MEPSGELSFDCLLLGLSYVQLLWKSKAGSNNFWEGFLIEGHRSKRDDFLKSWNICLSAALA